MRVECFFISKIFNQQFSQHSPGKVQGWIYQEFPQKVFCCCVCRAPGGFSAPQQNFHWRTHDPGTLRILPQGRQFVEPSSKEITGSGTAKFKGTCRSRGAVSRKLSGLWLRKNPHALVLHVATSLSFLPLLSSHVPSYMENFWGNSC